MPFGFHSPFHRRDTRTSGNLEVWAGNGSRAAMAVLLFCTTAIEPALAQTSSAPSSAQPAPSGTARAGQTAAVYSMEELSYLLEPVALYPDPLLALIFSASTFPVQIVEAQRWV